MIKQTIFCERNGCNKSFTEAHENQGFSGWGHVGGMVGMDENKKQLTITLCPECLNEVKKWLVGQT
jgi:hypothetical protein